MKRIIAVLLAVLLIASVFGACSNSQSATSDSVTANDDTAEGKTGKIKKATEAPGTNDKSPAPAAQDNSNLADSFEKAGDVSYVMIYNPAIYDEKSKSNEKLSTGELSKWIDTGASRADGLESEAPFSFVTQDDLSGNVEEFDVDSEGDRASGLQPTYKENEKHSFSYSSDLSSSYVNVEDFICSYAGKHCYVWTLGSDNLKESDIKGIGEEFDTKIYDKDVQMFGTPRYADENGKVHLLFHPIDGNTIGYFASYELFTSKEVPAKDIKANYLNVDHAIVHINSGLLGKGYDKVVYSTMAHEFQHMINFSDVFYHKTSGSSASFVSTFKTMLNSQTSTWLNEAMSGYVEEQLYPGSIEMEGKPVSFNTSNMLRNGQSLYNFSTGSKDIGAYANVYYFSEYLAKNGGSNVYSKLHKYWREKYTSSTDDAEGLYNSVDASYAKKIDGVVTYPSSISFKTKSQEWMSKMTLDYYLSTMKYDTSDPAAFKAIKQESILYDDVDAAKIEGGGRIVFATKNGSFTIPSDADKNLVYVGFDKTMKQVTKPIVK